MISKSVAFSRSIALLIVLWVTALSAYAQTTYFSRASTAWNLNTTWSTVSHVSAINTGTFPVAGDIVNIGGNFSVTINANAACATINIGDGSALTIGAATLLVSGITSVGGGTSGTLSITSNTGAKTFAGLVTINNGASWINTTEAVTFRGGITNNGTFTAGTGVHTFNTNSQSLTGTISIPSVTVTGAAVVLTNTNTLTVGTALIGSGRITQGAGATLNIGGTSTITNMTATASGNTVNYTGASQTVKNVAYENLSLTGSGTDVLQVGTTSITGNLVLSGTVSTSAVVGLTIGGSVNIGSGTSFTAGAFTHNVAGDWTNNGTFTGTGSTIIFNGAAQNITGGATTFNNVTLSGTGTKTFGVNPTLAIAGTLSINNGALANLSNTNTHTANSLFLGGAIRPAGTWGSTSSSPTATNQNNTFFSGNGLITVATGANSYYSIASTAWNLNTTWSNVGFGGAAASGTPGAGDYVFIGGGNSVTISGAESCSLLFFDAGTAVTNTLSITSGSLTVAGAITIPQTATSGLNILNVGSGALTASSLDFTSTPGGAGHRMTIGTGTATISGNITGIGSSSTIQFTGAGLLQVGGSLFSAANGTLTSVAGSTVEYTGAAQTVQALGYNNLTLSGSGNKTLAIATTTIGGNLTVGSGTTLVVGGLTLTVTGSTTVAGTLSLSTSTAGTKTFVGLATINGTWNNAINEAVTFRGGITNNGTFTAGTGVHTFNTNSQSLTGTFSIPSVTVTGAAVVLTNTNTLTVGTALIGSGRITQGAGATLNIGGTSTITNMTATASGNTVNYTGASQTVKNIAYENLSLTGSGTDVLQVGTTSITGNLALSGTVSTSAVVGLTIGGSVNIGSGTSFTAGAFTHNVGGDWTNNGGTFVETNSTIVLNGSGQTIGGSSSTTFNNLSFTGSGTKVLGVSTSIISTFSVGNGTVADLSNITSHTADILILGGAVQPLTGTWGSSTSGATNQNDIYFSNTGQITIANGAFTYYSRATGSWNDPLTWSTVGHGSATNIGTFPIDGDFAMIGGNFTVTVSADQASSSLSFDPGTSVTNTLIVNSGSTLAVAGAVIIPQTVTSGSNVLNVDGTLTAGSLDFTATPSGSGHRVTIGTGTATISGNITGIGASSTIQFTGSGLLQVGGSLFSAGNGTLTAPSGTVEYNGAVQTVQALGYNNLTLSGSGSKTLAATTTVGGDLAIGDGTTFTIGGVTLVVTGTTTVGAGTGGTLSITSATGTKTFVGLVTINNGASWSNITEGVTFRGGITNDGTFTAGTGVHTFNTNSQVLTGIFSIPSVTVTGAAVVLTNTNTLTVNTALGGTGRITQGAGATLNIGGTSAINNMTAAASGNTVNYNGAGQTVHSNAYENLGLSGTGIKSLQVGTSLIAGDLTLTGTASTTGVTNLTIGGDLNIGSATTFTSGAFDHIIGGDFINDGTFNHSNQQITFSGSATQSIQGTATTSFFDLHIAEGPNATDVQLDNSAGVNLVGEMTFDADAVFDADGPINNQIFTVISTATSDGRIGSLSGSADVTGNVTVQRYMDAEGKIYRYISTPVDNPTAEDLQGEIPITGAFTGSSFPPQTGCTSCAPCTGCVLNNTSMYQYNESIVAALNNRYTPFPSIGGANSETMVPGRGYAVYVRNDVSATTWNLRAPINTGEVNLNPTITGSNDGFNLVGNPYPSPIDWESGVWTRNAGIDPTIYIWDNSISNYASYTLGGGNTNGGSRYIATGQAFWVLASGSPDLRTQEGIKADQASIAQATFFRNTNPIDNLRIRLIASANNQDELLIKLNGKNASDGFDTRIDSYEFPSDTLLSLHSITPDNKMLAVNVLGAQSQNPTEINLGLVGTKPGIFSIDFMEFENFSTPTNVYLLDRFTGDLFEVLPANKLYQFTVTSDPASSGNRFKVFLTRDGKKPLLSEKDNPGIENSISIYPNPTSDLITVRVRSQDKVVASMYNTLGVQILGTLELAKSTGDEKTGQFDLSSHSAGVYLIQIQDGQQVYSKRIIRK